MNCRAFNLFTALVAFVMVLLVVILTNSMLQTEDKAIATVSDLSEQSEMQAVADLARADALQVFVYNMRFKMETWLTNQYNWFTIFPEYKRWENVKTQYVTATFGGGRNQAFANEATQQISGTLSVGSSFGRYAISLDIDSQNQEKMREALVESINRRVIDGTFFDVIGCTVNSGSDFDSVDCDPGTFFVNLDLSRGAFDPACNATDNWSNCLLDDQYYENLPKVIVRKTGTNDILEVPVLPRSNVRIYVPLRIFKAIAHAHKNGFATVFSDQYRNRLKKFRLGLCDRRSCMPRNGDIQNPTVGGWVTEECPLRTGTGGDTLPIRFSIGTGGFSYDDDYAPGRSGSATSQLNSVVQKFLCDPSVGVIKGFNPNPLETAIPNPLGCETGGISMITDDISKSIQITGIATPNQATCSHLNAVIMKVTYTESDPIYRVSQNNSGAYSVYLEDRWPEYREPFSPGFSPDVCHSTPSAIGTAGSCLP